MRQDELSTLQATARQLRGTVTVVDGEQIPDSVLFLERRLAEAQDKSTRVILYGLISDECVATNLYRRKLVTLRAEVAEFANEPVPLISLAVELRRDPATRDEARRVFEIALEKAVDADRFVRYALGERARFARMVNDLDLLQDCLKRLIADVGKKRSEDCGFETDFVSRLEDDLTVSPLVNEYLKAIGRSPMP